MHVSLFFIVLVSPDFSSPGLNYSCSAWGISAKVEGLNTALVVVVHVLSTRAVVCPSALSRFHFQQWGCWRCQDEVSWKTVSAIWPQEAVARARATVSFITLHWDLSKAHGALHFPFL